MDLSHRDRRLMWHPFTQEKIANPPTAIIEGKGSFVFDSEGNRLLDLISSWWVNIHGHSHPEIARAIYDQCLKLEHVIFSNFTHEPAITLCENLCQKLPKELTRFFFSDNGSTAVEVALKMTFQYWKNKGHSNKTTFISMQGAYHGDTFGAMSVGMKSGFHDTFTELCFPVQFIPFPDTWIDDTHAAEKEQHALGILKALLSDQQHTNEICALIVEPLVQGASGMRMCRPGFIRQMVELVRQHDILVIFDEVMTGFGRTGTCFALEQIGVVPDCLCLSKGITGGFLPLALTVTTNHLFQTFLDDGFAKALAHGHSYTANPVACAAAIASFNILIRPETKQSMLNINRVHVDETRKLLTCTTVQRVRVQGTIAAFDVKEMVDLKSLQAQCREKGLLIRALHRTVYMIPPYSITSEELQNAYSIIFTILNSFVKNTT